MNLRGLFHLLTVYIVWGSTYLAIRVAVREGAGFPPFYMASMRVLAAGVILWIWARLLRARVRPTRAEWGKLAASAVLLWVGGNGLVVWSEQRVESVYAALMVGALPLWGAVIEAILDRRAPSPGLIVSLLVGFAGIAVISYPELQVAKGPDLLSSIALIIAPISWGLGSILQQRRPVQLTTEASSSYQQLLAAVLFLILALGLGEPTPRPNAGEWAAWGYLVVFGSVIAFTSFVKALRLLPARIVMTYAYVNPVVAAFLGWLILHESITYHTLAGTVLVIAGVVGVLARKTARSPQAAAPTLRGAKPASRY